MQVLEPFRWRARYIVRFWRWLCRSPGSFLTGTVREESFCPQRSLPAWSWCQHMKFVMGGSDETKFDHPTQKPAELMRRPILNHTKRGELVYEPFLGSGTTLAAAELTERVCCGLGTC